MVVGGVAVAAAGAAFVLWPAASPAGARDRPLPRIAAGSGPLRLACIGTSLTARGTWPRALADRLAACRPVELGVFAAPGMGSDWGLAQLPRVRDFAPDLVLIEFLANDSDLLRLGTVAASRDRHARILAALRAAPAPPAVALLLMNPAFGARGLLRTRLPAFEAMYAALAAEHRLGLVDTVPAWRAALAETPRATLLPDGLHPDPAAQTRIMLATALLPITVALECAG
jgi:lysophospholipase L1-like esterase